MNESSRTEIEIQKQAEIYQNLLEAHLKKSEKEIIKYYLVYRSLLREIYRFLPEVDFPLPLFPQRQSGNLLNARLYALQGKSYANPRPTQDPPWTKQEKWIKSTTTILSLEILGEREVKFKYQYLAPDQTVILGEYEFEQDRMHSFTWYWNEAEVTAEFLPGLQIDCWVSDENPHRHRVVTVY